MHLLFAQKQNLFWEAKVNDSRGNLRKLWRTRSKVLGKEQKSSTPSKELTADNFLKAFSEKTDGVRQSTSSATYPKFDEAGCPHNLLVFELWTHQSVDPEFPEQELHSGSRSNLNDQTICQWTSAERMGSNRLKDEADLAWIFSAAEALFTSSWWTQHHRSTHQAGYAHPWPRRHDWQWSVTTSSHQPCYTNLFFPPKTYVFQDCIQPFGNEMLSWVRLHGINAHSVSPPAR